MPRLGSFTSRALSGIGLINSLLPPVDAVPMIMEVVIDASGLATPSYLKLGDGYNVEVNWGDGTIETLTSPGSPPAGRVVFHQYASEGTYTVSISGYLPQFGGWQIAMYSFQGPHFISRVLQWNNTTTDLSWAFEGEQLLTEVPAILPAAVTNLQGMFWGCAAFGNTPPITEVAQVGFYNGEVGGLYSGESYLTLSTLAPELISFLDTNIDVLTGRKVVIETDTNYGYRVPIHTGTIMSSNWTVGADQSYITFNLDTPFTSGYNGIIKFHILPLGTINEWDVSNVTNMGNMFEDNTVVDCYLGDWNVSNVTNMSAMFSSASGPVSTFSGRGLERWDVSSVTNMDGMFRATSMNAPIGGWDVSNVSSMFGMFERAPVFNQPIGGWDVSNVTNMDYMFDGMPPFQSSGFSQNLSGWATPLISITPATFGNDTGVNPTWGTSPTPMIMTWVGVAYEAIYVWSGLGDLLFPNACIDWGDGTRSVLTITRNPPDYEYKSGAWFAHQFPDSGTYTVTIRGYLPSFQGSMIAYGGPATPTTTGLTAVTEWNSTTVNLYGAFEHRTALTSVPNYLPSGVRDISAMFWEAASFNDPNISQWDTSLVTNMSDMFYSAASFNQDISNWDVEFLSDQWSGNQGLPPALLQTYYPIWGTQGRDSLTSEYLYAYSHTPGNFPSTISFTLDSTSATAFRISITTRAITKVFIRDASQNVSYMLVLEYTDFGNFTTETVGGDKTKITFIETNVAMFPNTFSPISATFTGTSIGKILR